VGRDELRREFLLEFTPVKAGAGMTLEDGISCYNRTGKEIFE